MTIAQNAENFHHLQNHFVVVFRKRESRSFFALCRSAYQGGMGIQFGDWDAEIQHRLNANRSLLFSNGYFRDDFILLEMIDQLWVLQCHTRKGNPINFYCIGMCSRYPAMLVAIDEIFSIDVFQIVDKIRHSAITNDPPLKELVEVERQLDQEFRPLPSLIRYRWVVIWFRY